MWQTKWKWAIACCAALVLPGGTYAAPPAKPATEQQPAWDVAREFLQLAQDGKTDEALKRCVPGTVSANKIKELLAIGYKETKITAVLINDRRAEVVLQKHAAEEDGKKLEGHLILMLVRKGDGPWQVKDIDFRDADRVKTLLESYLNGKYDTKPKK
jgi:hypothetical protein